MSGTALLHLGERKITVETLVQAAEFAAMTPRGFADTGGRDRRLQDVASGLAAAQRAHDQVVRLGDGGSVPPGPVLLLQPQQPSVGRRPAWPAARR